MEETKEIIRLLKSIDMTLTIINLVFCFCAGSYIVKMFRGEK